MNKTASREEWEERDALEIPSLAPSEGQALASEILRT